MTPLSTLSSGHVVTAQEFKEKVNLRHYCFGTDWSTEFQLP